MGTIREIVKIIILMILVPPIAMVIMAVETGAFAVLVWSFIKIISTLVGIKTVSFEKVWAAIMFFSAIILIASCIVFREEIRKLLR